MITESTGDGPVGLSVEQRERLRRLLAEELRATIDGGADATAVAAELDERRRVLEALFEDGGGETERGPSAGG